MVVVVVAVVVLVVVVVLKTKHNTSKNNTDSPAKIFSQCMYERKLMVNFFLRNAFLHYFALNLNGSTSNSFCG